MSSIRLNAALLCLAFWVSNPALAADPDLMGGSSFSTGSSLGVTDFSGVNLGIDLGAGLGSAGQVNTSGLIGGAHLGYHFQSSRLMGGAEADVLTSGIKSGSLATLSFQQKFLSSLRVKGGWVFGDLLAYGTLGYAYSTSSLSTTTGSDNKTNKGTVFGAGAELALTKSVSLRAEFLRYNFNSLTYNTPANSIAVTPNTNLLRAGANLRF